jgi:endothelin-converting enzyme/putative endopeptidase
MRSERVTGLHLALLLMVTPAVRAADTKPVGPGFDPAHIDRTVDPCVDFYKYACGGWLSRNPVPPDQPRWNRGSELTLRNREMLRDILEKTSAAGTPGAPSGAGVDIDRMIGDDYASCMDQTGIEALGAKPLEAELERIAKVRTKEDLARAVAHLQAFGADVAFDFDSDQDFKDATRVIAWLDQGGLGLPDRDYYLKDDPKSQELRKGYAAHVERMFGLLGEGREAAAADAKTVLEIETALARASLDRVSRREPANIYHLTRREDLRTLAPAFAWESYLTELGAAPLETLNVTAPEFVKALGAEWASVDVEGWKAYLRWHLAHAAAPLLSAAFVDEDFAFFGKGLRGAKEIRPRWQRCVQTVEGDLGDALGQRYVEATFGREGKERTQGMVGALEAALQKDIEALPWMTETTRRAALAKLHAVARRIGYPDRWIDYRGLSIVRGDALGNAQRANAFRLRRHLAKIGKPVDKAEWPFPPTTVNAGYNPLRNDITFSAAILQPPFYENRMDDAVNFGAIGSVIGHELTHGFDDQGRKFDEAGNMRDWWTEEDSREFEKRASCLVDQYSGYSPVADVKLNGQLTLGENTADNGGVRLSYSAFVSAQGDKAAGAADGFTPEQRFFLGFGQIACENGTDEMARMLAQVDPHSPGKFRVNGVVSNMPEFKAAFACKDGAPMVREPACRVW